MNDAATQASRCRRSLQHLRAARDAAYALMTMPTEQRRRRVWSDRPGASSIDPDLWLLHVRCARRRDDAALQTLVEHYQPYAESLARQHYRNGEALEDLVQVALEGLVIALRRFDPEQSRPFLAYARPTISGLIRRHFRDAGWAIRIPRRTHELTGPVREARELLVHDLGREPSTGEIADFLGIPESDVLGVMSARVARQTTSLEALDPASSLRTDEVVGEMDSRLSWIEDRTALAQAVEVLSADDRELLRLYFIEQMTQSEIAKRLRCSQMQVSRLLASAIRRLRRRIV